ncbi:MAG TPA: DCC1-like thiol-disulfide oxidoreductase family protein [Hyphomicrobiales bacterium]|nr:DCC1-like thiol-disulfide oxidoreductase family protein [Hyphomicrobiales bacterium]
MKPAPVEIIYDGECPFCSAYVRMVRLRGAVGPVKLTDGRKDHEAVARLADEGIDLNETMAVIYGGRIYAGPRAIQILSLLSSGSGIMNRLAARLLRNPRRADFFYPVLRAGRNTTLRLLGRDRIGIPR